MSQKPLIVVTGATGAQGGSVVKYLLEDGGFSIRGLTRNKESPKAKELAAKGVEVVQVQFDDLPAVTEAFKGAYGVFGNTQFWENMSEEKEYQHGKNLVDAAKAAGVKHFVWSTLEYAKDPYVQHCNSKARVNDDLKASGIPRTSLYTVFYFENFIGIAPFKKEGDQIIADWPLFLTDGPLGGFSVGETGAYVLAAFKDPKEWVDKDIKIISEIFTPRQFVATVEKVTGKKVVLKEVDRAAFEAARQYPNAEELWVNNEWFYKTNGNPGRDFDLTKKLNPKRQTLEEWFKAHLAAFPQFQ